MIIRRNLAARQSLGGPVIATTAGVGTADTISHWSELVLAGSEREREREITML